MGEGSERDPLLRDRAFRATVALSAALHLAVLAVAVWASPGPQRRLFYGASYAVQLVSAAEVGERRVGRAPARAPAVRKPARKEPVVRKRPPQKPPREAERRIARARPKREVKKPPEPNPEDRVAAAVERIRRRVAAEEAAGRGRQASAARRPGEGPAEQTGLRGSVRREALSLVGRAYFDRIIEAVHGAWNLPGNLPGRERMVAVVTFRVLRDGAIRGIRVERSSGNVHFDNSALRAVEKINPLPAFPAELDRDFLDIGVRFHNPES